MVALSITSKILPTALTELAYSEQLQAVGGSPPYTWNLEAGFGLLPTGMSLSSSGILSAGAGVIDPSQVGTYNFRLKVTDSAPASEVYDYTLMIEPYGFNRVPKFLLDTDVSDLVKKFLLDQTNRLRTERHFFRKDLLGTLGSTAVHEDHDILSRDWQVPSTHVTLRQVLEELYLLGSTSIKTIDGVSADATRDFTIEAGAGIDLTLITNGIRLDSSLLDTALTEAASSVIPGGKLSATTTSTPQISQAWLKQGDNWYEVGNIPDFAGKLLSGGMTANGDIALAEGDKSGSRVLHVLHTNGSTGLWLTRFNALTLVQEQQIAITITTPISGEPLVMTGPAGEVIVCYIETAGLYMGIFDPTDYTNITSPFVNPPTLAVASATSNPITSRLYGAVSDTNATAYVAYSLAGAGTVSEINITTGTFTAYYENVASPGFLVDLIIDSNAGRLWVLGADNVGGPSDNLTLWRSVSLPYSGSTPAGAFGAGETLDTASNGTYFRQGMSIIDDTGAGRSLLAMYVFNDTTLSPIRSVVTQVRVDNLAAWPSSTVGSPSALTRPQDVEYEQDSRFVRWWTDTDSCKAVFVEPTISDGTGALKRTILDIDGPTDTGILRLGGTAPTWVRVMFTDFSVPNASNLRVYDDQNVYTAIDPALKEENIYTYYDETTFTTTVENDSPFTWDMKLDILEAGSFASPPNLLIPCWQLAQAHQQFFNANAFYSSPSTSGANLVTWNEYELATTVTSGDKFENYYTVFPSEYDLDQGNTAAAYYFAPASAGTASVHTMVFRYADMSSTVTSAEAVIAAAVDAYIIANTNLPQPAGQYYTLAELDTVLSTTFATTYSTSPFNFYQYFLFTDLAGVEYHQGWFSNNYVENSQAYGPAPRTNIAPVVEHFIMAANAAPGVATVFDLAQPVLAAGLYVNGNRYWQGVDWGFSASNQIEYYNNAPEKNRAFTERITKSLTTVNATPVDMVEILLAEEDVADIEVSVIGRKANGSERGAFHMEAVFYRNISGDVTREGNTASLFTRRSTTSLEVNIEADTVTQAADVRVTGLAGEDVDWEARVVVTRIIPNGYPLQKDDRVSIVKYLAAGMT